MTQAPAGGPAQTTYQVASRQGVTGREAIRVFAITDGRAAEGGPAQAVYYVSDAEIAAGEFVISGNRPIPISAVGAQGAEYPPIAVYVVDADSVSDFPPTVEPGPEPDPIGDALRADAVAYWKMDEESGNLLDSSGNSNHLNIFSGTTARVSGKIDNALHINSDDAQAGIAETNGINLFPNSYSFSFWIKFTEIKITVSELPLWGKSGPDETDWEFGAYFLEFLTLPTRGRIILYTYSNTISADQLLEEEVWYFIIFSRDNDAEKYRVYIDNVLQGTSDIIAGDVNINNAPFYFGDIKSSIGTEKFVIDEFGIYTKVISSDERSYLYNSGAGRALFPAP